MVLENVFIFGKNTVTLENLKQWIWKTAATIIIYTVGGSRKQISINGMTYRMQHGVVILFIRFDWLGSDRLKQKRP